MLGSARRRRAAWDDVAVISTHALDGGYDVVMDCHVCWLLGVGLAVGDPGTRLS